MLGARLRGPDFIREQIAGTEGEARGAEHLWAGQEVTSREGGQIEEPNSRQPMKDPR